MGKENIVTVQLSLEAFGFTGMNKQEIEAALLTAIKTQLVFTSAKGQEIKMDIMQEVQVGNIVVEDEDGFEVLGEEVTY